MLDDDGNFILKVRGQGEYNISASVNLPIDDIKGGTNYDAALAQAKDTFAKNGKITGAEARTLFLSWKLPRGGISSPTLLS